MYFINSVFNAFKVQNKKTNDAMVWIMTKIDYPKLFNRLWYAHINPGKTVKFVVFEYDYTEWSYVKQGNPNVIEKMPNSNVLVHHAMKNPEFLKTMTDFFKLDGRYTTVYVRQKIGPDGQPNPHRKQLVVMFYPEYFERDEDDDYSAISVDV
jgi:hypothetical protein